MGNKLDFLGKSVDPAEDEGQAGEPGQEGQPGTDGGGASKSSLHHAERRLSILKYAYLVIVVAAAITLVVVVNQNKQLVNDIQNDRKRVTYDLCLDQNARHDQLIDYIQEQSLKRAQLEAKKAGKPIPTKAPPVEPTTQKIVDILAVKRDCAQVVINLFGSPPPRND